jgi:hypothetical protein
MIRRTPILSILADDIQEVIEVICVPLLATCVVPLRFHESWAAIVYLLYGAPASCRTFRELTLL